MYIERALRQAREIYLAYGCFPLDTAVLLMEMGVDVAAVERQWEHERE